MNNGKQILYKNINIIDLESGAIKYNTGLLSKGDIIEEIGTMPETICDDVIDCKSLYAVPSLIDMHVHITFNAFADGEMSLNNVAVNLGQAARHGICVVRDVGTHPQWSIQAVRQILPDLPLPEVVFSGAPLCIPNGHGWDYGVFVESEQLENYMKSHKDAGFEWVKIMNDPENHPLKYLAKTVQCAHKCRSRVGKLSVLHDRPQYRYRFCSR